MLLFQSLNLEPKIVGRSARVRIEIFHPLVIDSRVLKPLPRDLGQCRVLLEKGNLGVDQREHFLVKRGQYRIELPSLFGWKLGWIHAADGTAPYDRIADPEAYRINNSRSGQQPESNLGSVARG